MSVVLIDGGLKPSKDSKEEVFVLFHDTAFHQARPLPVTS